jgi:hypothetical protein
MFGRTSGHRLGVLFLGQGVLAGERAISLRHTRDGKAKI